MNPQAGVDSPLEILVESPSNAAPVRWICSRVGVDSTGDWLPPLACVSLDSRRRRERRRVCATHCVRPAAFRETWKTQRRCDPCAALQSGAVLDLGCRPNFLLFSDCTAVPRVPGRIVFYPIFPIQLCVMSCFFETQKGGRRGAGGAPTHTPDATRAGPDSPRPRASP